MTVTRRIAGHLFRCCHCRAANQRGNNECSGIVHSARSYHFVIAVWRTKEAESAHYEHNNSAIKKFIEPVQRQTCISTDPARLEKRKKRYESIILTQIRNQPETQCAIRSKSGLCRSDGFTCSWFSDSKASLCGRPDRHILWDRRRGQHHYRDSRLRFWLQRVVFQYGWQP